MGRCLRQPVCIGLSRNQGEQSQGKDKIPTTSRVATSYFRHHINPTLPAYRVNDPWLEIRKKRVRCRVPGLTAALAAVVEGYTIRSELARRDDLEIWAVSAFCGKRVHIQA